ncbi:MAG: hypothetical protein U1E05_08325 [Patescibacteria group bacterium]|nr:hypothetical protein [Patescibacteria group bacterium]
MVRMAAWSLLAAACLLALGCGGARRQAEQREESRLKPLALFYGQFTGQHRGRPPASETQLKEFIQAQGPEALASFQVNDVDALFVSERDGKPYVVLYADAAKGNPPGPAGAPVIAYEQEGAGGLRYVASSMGAVEEVDDARFRELVSLPAVP